MDIGLLPSFPIPHVLVTRIATNESFGIIPVPENIVGELGLQHNTQPVFGQTQETIPHYNGVPSHLVTRLSTKRTSPYEFLAERQNLIQPLIPLTSAREFQLFNELMRSGSFYLNTRGKQPAASNITRTVDFLKMAQYWAIQVHLQDPNTERNNQIHYKLPEQLERHHKVWVRARGQTATLANSEKMREKITTLLNDPQRTSHVLPAHDLPSQAPRLQVPLSLPTTIPRSIERPQNASSQIATPNPTVHSGFLLSHSNSPLNVSRAPTQSVTHGNSRAKKKCAACRDAKCPLMNDCSGSGNRNLCFCVTTKRHGAAKR